MGREWGSLCKPHAIATLHTWSPVAHPGRANKLILPQKKSPKSGFSHLVPNRSWGAEFLPPTFHSQIITSETPSLQEGLMQLCKGFSSPIFKNYSTAQVVVTHINCYLNSFISNSTCLSFPKVRAILSPQVLLIESFRPCIALHYYFTSISKLSVLTLPSTLLDVNYSSHNAMIICLF